ncbi:MAG TPA: DUF971 domain-containing protein [Verrucomicrobiota bacterium]|nr:DUF971 domain-containing protein [Verrucomicrobiota bacterium]
MPPADIQVIGTELAIRWAEGGEAFIQLETLRRCCPCAACLGEQDVLGNVYRPPERPYTPASFELVRLDPVGGYALRPAWRDGHATGLFSWEYLRRLAAGGEAPQRIAS